MTPKEVLALCREKAVKAVDFRFCDLLGAWQHTTLPVAALHEDLFSDGIGFDGSSIRGWQAVHESDLLMIPRPDTAFLDPFTGLNTLNLICEVFDPLTMDNYPLDPRHVARQATRYLKQTAVADRAMFGPEAEFHVFDDVRFEQNSNSAFFYLDSRSAQWNRGREEMPNLGHKLDYQNGYSPVPPNDQLMDLRNEMMQTMIACGVDVECHHHEVGSAGQSEIDVRYADLVPIGDRMMIYKYVVKNVARKNGCTATFMPKPVLDDNGSGLHVHFSLWKKEKPLFAGPGYGGLSDLAVHAIGGILHHAPALAALTNPTTNSYKRLIPGFEAPVHLTYSHRNRSAACRIPMYHASPDSKRIEIRFPDPGCNPYLAFAAILMAALDGIQNKLEPGPPVDQDLHKMDSGSASQIRKLPASLDEALTELENDYAFLLKGDVFPEELIRTWIDVKRNRDVETLKRHPHPQEFCLYYDI